MMIKNRVLLFLIGILSFQCKPEKMEPYAPQLDFYLKFKLNDEPRTFYGNEIVETQKDFNVTAHNKIYIHPKNNLLTFNNTIDFKDLDGERKRLRLDIVRLDATSFEKIAATIENELIAEGPIIFPFKTAPTVFNTPDTMITIQGMEIDSFLQNYSLQFIDSRAVYNTIYCDSTSVSDTYFKITNVELMKDISIPNFKDILVFEAEFDLKLCDKNGNLISLEEGEMRSFFGIDPLREK